MAVKHGGMLMLKRQSSWQRWLLKKRWAPTPSCAGSGKESWFFTTGKRCHGPDRSMCGKFGQCYSSWDPENVLPGWPCGRSTESWKHPISFRRDNCSHLGCWPHLRALLRNGQRVLWYGRLCCHSHGDRQVGSYESAIDDLGSRHRWPSWVFFLCWS